MDLILLASHSAALVLGALIGVLIMAALAARSYDRGFHAGYLKASHTDNFGPGPAAKAEGRVAVLFNGQPAGEASAAAPSRPEETRPQDDRLAG